MAQYDDPAPDPTFAMFAREIIRSARVGVRTAYPAMVLAYYPPDSVLKDPAMVDVQLARKHAHQVEHAEDAASNEVTRDDPQFGILAVADVKPIPRVVVQYPGFAGMRMTGPIPIGEEGLLITCDRSIDRWVRRGAEPVQDPVFQHHMNWKDSIFVPGLRSGADVGFDVVPSDGWRLGDDAETWELLIDIATKALRLTTTGPSVTVDGTAEVKVGENATSFAAKADVTDSNFDAIKTIFASQPPVLTPANAVAALTNIIAFFQTWPAPSVTAVKAKVE